MALYPQYPKYKSTPCPWLKDVPDHWSVKRIKNVATCNDEALDEKSDPDLEIEYVDISSVTLINGVEKSETMTFEKAPSRARRKVKHGDVIVSTVRTYLKAIAPINNPPENMIVSTGFAVVRPMDNLHSGFAGYLLQSNGFVGDVVANSVGVSYPAINASDLVRIPAVEPPISEQESIARFLNYKTAQIDALIAKKQALLTKLAEKRTALISHAVTKGLDPSVPMRDSEVEWLGDIPKHWKVLALRYACDFLNRRRIPLSSEERGSMSERVYPYYGASGIIDFVEDFIFDEKTILIAEDGANLLSRSTPLAFIADGKYWVNNHAHILNPMKGPFEYWANLLCIIQYEPWITGSAQPKLSKENLGGIKLPLPPREEQETIVKYIAEHTDEIDPMIKKVVEAIERLREYRSALITNAVTGKIDVRNFNMQGSANMETVNV